MRLNASVRLLAVDSRHTYSDEEGEYAMTMRWKRVEDKKFIKTDNPEFRFVVGKSWLDYYVFILEKGEAAAPIGYVRFQVRLDVPEKARHRIYTPHSFIRESFRGKHLISSIYKWFF